MSAQDDNENLVLMSVGREYALAAVPIITDCVTRLVSGIPLTDDDQAMFGLALRRCSLHTEAINSVLDGYGLERGVLADDKALKRIDGQVDQELEKLLEAD